MVPDGSSPELVPEVEPSTRTPSTGASLASNTVTGIQICCPTVPVAELEFNLNEATVESAE